MMKTDSGSKRKRLHASVLIFLVCLLFTFLVWDHYFNSEYPLNRAVVSNLILLMGTLFSAASGLFTFSLEQARANLEAEVERRTIELRRRNDSLERAMQEIKALRGFIPICAACKKIRNDQGYWEQMEEYIQQHSEVKFSHGLCQDCRQRLYPRRVAAS